jgi:hypothetical protein
MIPPRPAAMAEQNGTSNGSSAAGRINSRPANLLPEIRVRELPFFPTRSILLRPCALVPKEDVKVSSATKVWCCGVNNNYSPLSERVWSIISLFTYTLIRDGLDLLGTYTYLTFPGALNMPQVTSISKFFIYSDGFWFKNVHLDQYRIHFVMENPDK